LSYGEDRKTQAYCYHPYCWGYVTARSKENVTAERLLRFAQSSTHLFCLPGSAYSKSAGIRTAVALDSRLLDNKFDDLLKQLEEKIPPDLQRIILDYAGTCPASSILHIIYAGTVDLLQRVVLESNRKILCPFVGHMTFNFVFIEDSWLWCGCTTDKGVFGYRGPKTIPAEIPPGVNIVKFTVGRFGIQGLQFRGPSGVSILVGEFQESLWTGMMISLDPLQHLLLRLDVS
jgi:hypothetical protein